MKGGRPDGCVLIGKKTIRSVGGREAEGDRGHPGRVGVFGGKGGASCAIDEYVNI